MFFFLKKLSAICLEELYVICPVFFLKKNSELFGLAFIPAYTSIPISS